VIVVLGPLGVVGGADSCAHGFSDCKLLKVAALGTLPLDNTCPTGDVVMFPVAVVFVTCGFDTTCSDGTTGIGGVEDATFSAA